MKIFFTFLFTVLILFTACRENDNPPAGSSDPSRLFLNGQVIGNEDNDIVTVKFQLHHRSAEGSVISPDSGFVIYLDNENIQKDSAKLSGTFFELIRPADGFEGKHDLRYVISGTENTESFIYKPFQLTKEPDTVLHLQSFRNNPMFIALNGVSEKDVITVTLTDTSLNSGLTLFDTVQNSGIKLNYTMLSKLAPGPVMMDLQLENGVPFSKKNGLKGRIMVSYGLKRTFRLLP